MALHDGGRSPCIDENAVLDFVQGRLGEVEVARIDEHADGCLSCRQAIDEAVRAFRERSTGFDLPPDPLVTRFAAGDKLAGRYRIIRFIARGGMGEVYEAEDEMLGTHIAVKTVAAPISDNPLAARRLKQEVNLARRITHPNVCRIFDLGVHHGGADRPGAGVLFITMELIAGISLAQRLRDAGPAFARRRRVPIARAMAAAIGAAHRAGVDPPRLQDAKTSCSRRDGGGRRAGRRHGLRPGARHVAVDARFAGRPWAGGHAGVHGARAAGRTEGGSRRRTSTRSAW